MTRSPRRGPGGIRISRFSSRFSAASSSARSSSYFVIRAFPLACRARGAMRIHSSSRSRVRRRAEASFSSWVSRWSFCSSQEE